MTMKPNPIPPQPGQESVWDYPRPPRLEDTDKSIRIIFNNVVLAETNKAKRVLETSHPPSCYIPPEDVKVEYLISNPRKTFCEWKGYASYYDISVDAKYVNYPVWRYLEPTTYFLPIKGYYSFYANLMDACYVNDELVKPQAGNLYGGWITSDIVGPFKGEAGTRWW
ncbi:MAG: DUF427 domain-containing protein [Trichodesmium sp. MAG_R02]|nr:DUF427 domain-containing protein [Trichodesmium sp. MAG_R02]